MGNKKYWYIRLNLDFFNDERIDFLDEQPNGGDYVVIYLRLCFHTANTNGMLYRQLGDLIIPYDEAKIAQISHRNIDIVRSAMSAFKALGLILEADGECSYMRLPEVENMVGYTTDAAKKQAEYRRRKMESATANPLPSALPEQHEQEEEREEPEEPEEKPKAKAQKHKHGMYNNVLLTDDEYSKLSEEFPDLEQRIDNLSEYMASTGKAYKSHYATIKAWARKDSDRPAQASTPTVQPKQGAYKPTAENNFGMIPSNTDLDEMVRLAEERTKDFFGV